MHSWPAHSSGDHRADGGQRREHCGDPGLVSGSGGRGRPRRPAVRRRGSSGTGTSAGVERVAFLIDNDLSWRLAEALHVAGFDAIHVRDLNLGAAPDELVLAAAVAAGRVLVTRDGDFARMLAATAGRRPSVLLFRSQIHDRPGDQAPLLLAAIRSHARELAMGAFVVVQDDGVRAHPLPLGG
jgi:predicted nuclease of predicted toxin-antitoxin system